jgi:hypothetical protein
VSLGVLVVTEILPTAGVHQWFSTKVLAHTHPAWHLRSNETHSCPYNAVCWIHMEE